MKNLEKNEDPEFVAAELKKYQTRLSGLKRKVLMLNKLMNQADRIKIKGRSLRTENESSIRAFVALEFHGNGGFI